eukprot:8063389-Pyramimonas_sp.AAC.1
MGGWGGSPTANALKRGAVWVRRGHDVPQVLPCLLHGALASAVCPRGLVPYPSFLNSAARVQG